MKHILLGLFKRLICLPIAVVMVILAFPFVIIPIAHFIYWAIIGRDFMDDSAALMSYSLS